MILDTLLVTVTVTDTIMLTWGLAHPVPPAALRQVDEEMAVLLQNLKDMVEAERAAKLGKKGKKKKKAKKKKKVRISPSLSYGWVLEAERENAGESACIPPNNCLAMPKGEHMDAQPVCSQVHLLGCAQGKKEKKGKKKKDPTADRSIESLFAELVSNGILQVGRVAITPWLPLLGFESPTVSPSLCPCCAALPPRPRARLRRVLLLHAGHA